MRYVQILVYSITALGALITGFKRIQVWDAMEYELDWRTAGRSPFQRMFRNVGKQYEIRDRELPHAYKRWSLLSIFFVILLVIEVLAFRH